MFLVQLHNFAIQREAREREEMRGRGEGEGEAEGGRGGEGKGREGKGRRGEGKGGREGKEGTVLIHPLPPDRPHVMRPLVISI